VACGTNASSTSDWGKITIGCPGDVLTGSFNFRGRVAGLRVSNAALYTSAFIAPLALTQLSSIVALLGSNFKETRGNATLTATAASGAIEQFNEVADGKIYELRWDLQVQPATGRETVIDFPTALETRGFYGTLWDTTNNWFKPPVDGLYRFEVSITVASTPPGGRVVLIISKNTGTNRFISCSVARGSSNPPQGGAYTVTVPCSTLDTIRFSVQADLASPNTLNGLNVGPYGAIISTYCSISLVE
jgi:hypothetical protein